MIIMIKIMIIVCVYIWNLSALKWKHEQQEGESEHHKMGGRSASGLEELIMGCTSSSSITHQPVSLFLCIIIIIT